MDTLVDLQSLKPGYGLISKNGKYKMDYGTDGTLNIIGIVTDENGNVVIDKKTGMVKTKRIWESRIKRTSNIEGALTLENGVLNVYDHKGDERTKSKGEEDEDGGSKLVMQDNGLLTLYNSAGKVTWSAPKRSPEEGFTVDGTFTETDYINKIKLKRDNLQDKTRELLRMTSPEANENKSRMDWSILVNISWTVIAFTLLYYLIVN
ncbi:MAG: hypothetical protein ACOVRN_00690 [Flavobacterium sp.]